MGIFDWLFGEQNFHREQSGTHDPWSVSENGNAMIIINSVRITVFQNNSGWKYCIAKIHSHKEPYFSELYASEQAARDEALAKFHDQPSRHES